MSTTKPKQLLQPIIVHAEAVDRAPPETFADLNYGTSSWKTLVSFPQTQSNSLTAGKAFCQPGQVVTCPSSPASTISIPGHLAPHRHSHAEIYYMTAGQGVVTIDGKDHEVRKGSMVWIPGDAEHGARCTGEEALEWFYVFAADGFADIVYRFSRDEKREMAKL